MIEMVLELFTETLYSVWPMLTIFLVVLISIRLTYIHVNREKFVFYKEFMNLIFLIYALLLFNLLTNSELNNNSGYNLIPFTEILRYDMNTTYFKVNVLGNIALFIPFGYFISGYVRAKKMSHILFISIITSTVVEFVQHFIGRSFDIDDIILNVTGAVIGFLIYIGFNAIEKHLPRFLQSDLFYNLICLILCIIGGIYYLKVMGIHLF